MDELEMDDQSPLFQSDGGMSVEDNPGEMISLSVDDEEETDKIDNDALSKSALSAHLKELFSRAKEARMYDERRWLEAYYNYRGIYPSDYTFREDEQSRVFVKITKTKVLAAYNQIVEVLLGNNRFPISVDPTSLPEGIVEEAHISLAPEESEGIPKIEKTPDYFPESRYRFKDTKEKVPTGTFSKVTFGSLEPYIELLPEGTIKEGPAKSPKEVSISPALRAAKRMEKKIHDQLEESQAIQHLRKTAFECSLFGTGVMKGPFITTKEYPNWTKAENGVTYTPVKKDRPSITTVSLLNIYPDNEADTVSQMEFVFERHKMSKTDLRELKNRPFFRGGIIEDLIKKGPNYTQEWWETAFTDNNVTETNNRWEVLEFWGNIDVETLEEFADSIDMGSEGSKKLKAALKEVEDEDYVSCNIWISGDAVLRCILNPFTPKLIPYYLVPYEFNPFSLFGIGVAENMSDSQMLMNGFVRLAVDNAIRSGNLIFEVQSTYLTPGQDLKMFPGKVFEREEGAPGQAIFAHQYPDISKQNLEFFDFARKVADEATGIPSFAHGETGVQQAGRTASGISMLMEAANGTIKAVIKNFDDFLLGPLGNSLFAYNMQYDPDPDIRGDLSVNARGTESLMANAVRSQRLMQFLGTVQSPMLAPFAKMDYIVREIARSLDLDPDKVANDIESAAIQAALLKKFTAPPVDPNAQPPQGGPQKAGNGSTTKEGTMDMKGPPGQPNAPKGPPGVEASNMRGTGGGQTGVGGTPLPGDQSFSANKG